MENSPTIHNQPTVQQNPAEQPAIPPSNKRKKIIILSIIAVVFFVIAAVVAYIYMSQQEPKKDTVRSEVSKKQSVKKDKPKLTPITSDGDIEPVVKQALSKNYKVVTDLTQGEEVPSGSVYVEKAERSPSYKVDGYDFYINNATGGTLLGIKTSKDAYEVPMDIYNALVASLVERSFKEINMSEVSSLYKYYTNGEVVCSVSTQTFNTMNCDSVERYDATAAEAAPVVAAFRAAKPTLAKYNVIFWMGIEDSPVTGYKRAYFSGASNSLDGPGGGGVAFYQKQGGAWTYFTSTMQVSSCAAYNTEDLKNAFKGTKCLGPAPNYDMQTL